MNTSSVSTREHGYGLKRGGRATDGPIVRPLRPIRDQNGETLEKK